MSLLDKASLIQIPSGYKNGKLYSVKPNPTFGSEQISNGDFATNSDWTLTSSANITNGKLNVSAGAFDFFAIQTALFYVNFFIISLVFDISLYIGYKQLTQIKDKIVELEVNFNNINQKCDENERNIITFSNKQKNVKQTNIQDKDILYKVKNLEPMPEINHDLNEELDETKLENLEDEQL